MIENAFDFFQGSDLYSDDCVAVFGHVRPSFGKSLPAISSKSVFALKPRFRIYQTIAILESVKLRLEFSKRISQRSKSLLFDFLDTEFGKRYLQSSNSLMDLGLCSSRGFLDSIDRDEIKLLSLLISFEALLDLPILPKYAIYPHDPHGLSDISFYYVLRYLGISIYSYRCISETPYSLVFHNIYDRISDVMSLTTLDCLVKNISPVAGSSRSWFNSVSHAVQSGAWADVDAVVKYCSVKPFAPSTGKLDLGLLDSLQGFLRKLSQAYLVPSIKLISSLSFKSLFSKIYQQLGRTYFSFMKFISRRVNFAVYSYSHFCISRNLCMHSMHELPDRYVYIPFHLQPENTTFSLGLEYNNQLLFLRKVRSLLPSDVTIIVKDHPCSSSSRLSYARPSNYFEYISSMIPGVKFAPLNILSRDLISKALCTFTVNGTACLESSLMGKPAVFGGLSLFTSLPNVSHINSFQSPEDFDEWLLFSSQISTLDPGFKSFFSSRESFMHDCVLYGAVESSHGVRKSYDSLERHYSLNK